MTAGVPYKLDQTLFGHGRGNCFQVAVASVLGLDMAVVPHFCDGAAAGWFTAFEDWLSRFQMYPLMLDAPEIMPPGWTIVSGHSPRYPDDPRRLHAVVYHDGELWHDPHPSRDGLLGVSDVIVFVPLGPPLATLPGGDS